MNRDRFRVARVLLFAFIALSCLRAWLGPFALEREAAAQLPNSGARLSELLSEAKTTNRLLTEIRDHLKSGVTKVKSIDDKNE